MRPSLAARPRPRRAPILPWLALALLSAAAHAAEPDPATYWDVNQIRPGMTGVGKTVLVGTALEEFKAEVLGVMRDVSPGRDMVLCRLEGCKLEHSGIVQGMSGSPIYIDGKLLGAVAYAWEFGKDPIAGVTPFSQMVQYVRSSDRRIAAEARGDAPLKAASFRLEAPWETDALPAVPGATAGDGPTAVAGGGLAGMRPIATPLAATGFSPRALAFLSERMAPLGMAAMAGGGAMEEILRREGDKPLVPGAPMSVAMVTGDFDLSGIGTVTHVEGDRVYGFGHPMMSLGACELPLMTGYIHTVYPRASVSMKMGSPLKVVGVLDTDVSTAVAGRLGRVPDMLPMSVRVKVGRYSEPRTYNVRVVREPNMMATLVTTVLANAIDTEGNLPEELTAHVTATIRLKDRDPIVLKDTFSGPRYTGPMGPMMLFGQVAGDVNMLVRNPMEPVRIEAIDCEVDVAPGRTTADVASVRLASDRLEPGDTLKATVTLKPWKGDRQTVELALPLPADLPTGTYEAAVCDQSASLRRLFRNQPHRLEPRDLEAILTVLRDRAEPKRTQLALHVPLPDRGLAVKGQALPNLPSSARAVLAGGRETPPSPIRDDLVVRAETPWVVEGATTIKFNVVEDSGLAAR